MFHPLRILRFAQALLLNRYTFFVLFLLGYTAVLEDYGGLPSLNGTWRLEIPLLLYLYFLGNLITRKSPLQPVIVAAPIVLLYVVFDIYHLQLGRLPRLIELAEVPELLAVMPFWLQAILIGLCGGALLSCLSTVRWRAFVPITLGLLPVISLAVAVEFYPDAFMTAFVKTQKEIIFYSDVKSVANNGRFSMTLYNEARRKSVLIKTARYLENPFYLVDMDKAAEMIRDQRGRRNVHLIVLESFLDPDLLLAAKFSRRPAHPEFDRIFKRKGGFSVSPVFGGSTAQAEFELLCGVPAMRELSGVEFNLFTGASTPCLPNLLEAGGYHTLATNGHRPDFFNSTNAYEGIGFAASYYPVEFAPGRETYLSMGDVSGEDYMFDGDLLSQNLEHVAARLKEHPETPVFNYVISMYGHTPNLINTEKRPEVVKVLADIPGDKQLERSINQYYYRTEAIAAYVKELLRIDPKSLVILVSDHLPPLGGGPDTYRNFNYLGRQEGFLKLNRIYFVENGRSVETTTIHHYDVPAIILDYVTRRHKVRKSARIIAARKSAIDIATYRKAYMTIMARAMMVKEMLPSLRPAPAVADATAVKAAPVGGISVPIAEGRK
ncbi:MAG: LTA synthase family protein [Desulfobulbaceae bacterium]